MGDDGKRGLSATETAPFALVQTESPPGGAESDFRSCEDRSDRGGVVGGNEPHSRASRESGSGARWNLRIGTGATSTGPGQIQHSIRYPKLCRAPGTWRAAWGRCQLPAYAALRARESGPQARLSRARGEAAWDNGARCGRP